MLKFMRKNTMAAKIPLIILVFCLIFGLLGSYLVWQSPPVNDQPTMAEDLLLAEVKEMEEKLLTYQEKVEADPENLTAWIGKANLEYDFGNLLYEVEDYENGTNYFKQATESYQQALKYEPENIKLITDLATAAMRSWQDELAEANFQKAIALDPNFLDARVNYGFYLYNVKGDQRGAIKEWEAALDTKPDSEEVVKALEALIEQAKNKE